MLPVVAHSDKDVSRATRIIDSKNKKKNHMQSLNLMMEINTR